MIQGRIFLIAFCFLTDTNLFVYEFQWCLMFKALFGGWTNLLEIFNGVKKIAALKYLTFKPVQWFLYLPVYLPCQGEIILQLNKELKTKFNILILFSTKLISGWSVEAAHPKPHQNPKWKPKAIHMKKTT